MVRCDPIDELRAGANLLASVRGIFEKTVNWPEPECNRRGEKKAAYISSFRFRMIVIYIINNCSDNVAMLQ